MTDRSVEDGFGMLDKTFEPREVDARWYPQWEASGAFAADPDSAKPPYTIMMPPPNVTGSLHMGHALTFTLQDILIRFERMRGRDALWQPGTDHAGIATEIVVTNQLAERQINKRALGRDKFVERVWEWKAESGGTIVNQLRRLGCFAGLGARAVHDGSRSCRRGAQSVRRGSIAKGWSTATSGSSTGTRRCTR